MTSKPNRPTSPRFRSSLTSTKTLLDSLVRLNPLSLLSNPVMFIVELTFFIVAAMAIYPPAFYPVANSSMRIYYVEVSLILLITAWFSTLADALAETQAKNTASSLRSLESEVQSKKIVTEADVRRIVTTPSTALRKGDLILLEKNDVVPIDAEVLEGIGMVDESLLTGESTPVRMAPGDEVIWVSRVISDTLTALVTVNPEDTYISEMIRLVESSKRPRTPNEVAVTTVLIGLTAIFTIIVVALLGLSVTLDLAVDLSVLIALYVCLLPTTIGALLPSIGLSGVSRLYQRKIVAKSGRTVERAGDTDVIILDKHGTITVGNRQAVEFIPVSSHTEKEVGEAAFLSSWHDDTPEGRSLIRLAYEDGFVPRELNALGVSEVDEFSASTRTSGVKISQGTGFMLPQGDKSGRERGRLRRKFEAHQEAGSIIGEDEIEIIKGAPDVIKKIARSVPSNYDELVDEISSQGDTPLAVTRNREVIGVIRLKDVLKPGIREKILSVKVMGIRPVMLTGDQPLTAKSIASEVGIDQYRPEAKHEDKYDIVTREQAETRVVAMIGDGTNDAPALAVADVGLAMNSGTQAAKEAANMVDLESNPAKIIEVVMLGKQLLMTRGAVTTFRIANDVAKYFAIVPALFAATLPWLKALDFMHLTSPTSAILSAVIFNALVIPLLIPIALKGVTYRPVGADALLRRNLLVWGLGGVVAPFVGIKLIDLLLVALGMA